MDEETGRELTELDAANARLRASLEQCRKMVADYRRGFVANTNNAGEPNVDSDDLEESG